MPKITVITSGGEVLEFNSEYWRKEGNLLIIDYGDKKDDEGKPLLYGQIPDWQGFKVDYD